MPRVTFVKAARKDNPVAKKGESYYWWKFRYGGKRYSLKRPRPSQLTRSAYYGTVRSLCEQIEDASPADSDALIELRDEIVSELESLRDETQGSLDNMPDQLQYSPTGELLQERIDAIENALSEIKNINEYDEEPSENDFDSETECNDCDGSGQLEPEDGEPTECEFCEGTGHIEDNSEYEQAYSDWESGARDHIDNSISEMEDAVSNCEV